MAWARAAALSAALISGAAAPAFAGPAEDAKAVAALDVQYQAAAKANDPDGVAKLLGNGYVLVLANGTTRTKADMVEEARTKHLVYEARDEEPGTQTVRVFDNTAVVTAKLAVKAKLGERTLEAKQWFSATYERTKRGWTRVFEQTGGS
jgi:hypothetical protein